MDYTTEEQELLAAQFICNYKNKDLTFTEVKSNYELAFKYILDNFEDIVSKAECNGNIASFSEGDRAVTYRNDSVNIINDNPILKALLGKPFLKVF